MTALHCPDLPSRPDSTHNATDTVLGTVVNYTCVIGHLFPGGLSHGIVTCMKNGQWEGSPLMETCARKKLHVVIAKYVKGEL